MFCLRQFGTELCDHTHTLNRFGEGQRISFTTFPNNQVKMRFQTPCAVCFRYAMTLLPVAAGFASQPLFWKLSETQLNSNAGLGTETSPSPDSDQSRTRTRVNLAHSSKTRGPSYSHSPRNLTAGPEDPATSRKNLLSRISQSPQSIRYRLRSKPTQNQDNSGEGRPNFRKQPPQLESSPDAPSQSESSRERRSSRPTPAAGCATTCSVEIYAVNFGIKHVLFDHYLRRDLIWFSLAAVILLLAMW